MRQTIVMRRYKRRLGPPLRATPDEEKVALLISELSQRRMARFDRLPADQRHYEANGNSGMAGEPRAFQIKLHRFLWDRQQQLGVHVIDEPPSDFETLDWDWTE